MANEITVQTLGAGLDGYFQIRRPDLTIYNGTTFEAYNAPDWATQYARGQAPADDSGAWKATFPVLAAGYYLVQIFSCATGGTPDPSDPFVGSDEFYWDGEERLDRSAGAQATLGQETIDAIVEAIQGNTPTTPSTSRANAEAIINDGGSVMWRGKIYTTIESLPEDFV